MIGLGVLGFAHGHVDTYLDEWRARHADGIRAVAGWDHDAARLAQAVQRHGVEACPSPQDLLRRPGVDAVVIAAETNRHADLVGDAAKAGKPIILQKPIALRLEEADRIVKAVAQHGVPFTMAWQMRVDPLNMKMKALVESGVLGRLLMVRRRHGLTAHLWPAFAQSWHVTPELNRGMWADDAAHPVDFMLWLLGEPVSVTAEIATLVNRDVPDDHGIAVFTYGSGTIAEVVCSFACVAGENTTEILGDRGLIVQNHGDVPSTNIPRPPGGVAHKWFRQETGAWELSDLVAPANHSARIIGLAGPLREFLEGRRPPIATAEEGRTALKMILASHLAAEQGRRVSLAEIRS